LRYFRLQQEGDRWALVDPAGNRFFSLGVDCVCLPASYENREALVSKYGGDAEWFRRFADAKLKQLKAMGFNTLGAWHDRYYLRAQFPKTIEIRMSRRAKKANTVWGTGFPDVFDCSFEASVEDALVEFFYGGGGRDLVTDETVIGYFTDNELHWWGSSGYWGDDAPGEGGLDATGLVDDYIRLAPSSAGKKAWVEHLKSTYRAIDDLNAAWNSEYCEFDDLIHLSHYRAEPTAIKRDKEAFLRLIAERYFQITSSALKRFDPNHLNLGCRVVGVSTPRVVLDVMKEYVDVISLNHYTIHYPSDYHSTVYELTGKPLMVTEFSVCAGREAGFLINTNGARSVLVKDQKRRGEVYGNFVTTAFSLPFVVGTHWFALYDFGNVNGLIGNYGLLDLKDNPYTVFTDAVTSVHAQLGKR
jgi:hypothetical protein